jgi:hypothetical protein
MVVQSKPHLACDIKLCLVQTQTELLFERDFDGDEYITQQLNFNAAIFVQDTAPRTTGSPDCGKLSRPIWFTLYHGHDYQFIWVVPQVCF